jgi:hypothetical protein
MDDYTVVVTMTGPMPRLRREAAEKYPGLPPMEAMTRFLTDGLEEDVNDGTGEATSFSVEIRQVGP